MPLTRVPPGQESALQHILSREPLYNLFLIANLNEGIGPDQEVWQCENQGILARRFYNWAIDAGPDPFRFDFAAAAAIIDDSPPELLRGLVGSPESVEPLYARLTKQTGRLYQQVLAVMPEEPSPFPYSGHARPARPTDLDILAAIYTDAGDMSRPRAAVERMLPTAWVLEDEGEITSVANVASRTPQAAMVGAVYTPPRFRKKGYASTLVHAVSKAILAEGRLPCLFYHNPEAGRIYLRLGYRELGPWRMVRFTAQL